VVAEVPLFTRTYSQAKMAPVAMSARLASGTAPRRSAFKARQSKRPVILGSRAGEGADSAVSVIAGFDFLCEW
jgi:hypothetical protein